MIVISIIYWFISTDKHCFCVAIFTGLNTRFLRFINAFYELYKVDELMNINKLYSLPSKWRCNNNIITKTLSLITDCAVYPLIWWLKFSLHHLYCKHYRIFDNWFRMNIKITQLIRKSTIFLIFIFFFY